MVRPFLPRVALEPRRCWRRHLGSFVVVLLSLASCGCHSASNDPTTGGPASSTQDAAAAVSDLPRTSTSGAKAIALPEPSAETPFVAVASSEARKLAAGDTFEFVIQARTLSGWHIYAVDKPTGISIPTSLDLVLPQGVLAASDWKYPKAEVHATAQGASFVYRGPMTFTRELQLADDAKAGVYDIVCQLRFQACDAFSCLSPETVELSATVEVDSTGTRGAEAE